MKKLGLTMIILWSLIGVMILAVLISSIVGGARTGSFSFNPFVSSGELELLVDESIPSGKLDAVNIELSSDTCDVYLTDGGNVNIKHYGRGLSPDRYVKISERSGTLTASTKKSNPVFSFGFNDYSRIEVYLPRSYAEKLNIDISSGMLAFEDAMNLSELGIKVSSGTVRSDYEIKAPVTNIKVTSGSIKLTGGLTADNYSIGSSSGTINVDKLAGSGGIEVTSGTVRLSGVDIKEHLSVRASSGTINIGIAGNPGLQFTGRKSSGTIKTYFGNFGDGNVSATTGVAPFKNLDVQVTSGTVRITQE